MIGSVFASLYHSGLDSRDLVATAASRAAAKQSIGAAIATARQLGAEGTQLLASAQRAFFDGFQAGCLVAARVLLAGAVAIFLPSRPALDGHRSN